MLKFESVTKRFGTITGLDRVDLEIARGERVALVGSNGAGKSTLIRCLLGELRFEGRILVDGQDPRHARQAVLSEIGFVPQVPPAIRMPVAELVGFAARLSGQGVEPIEAAAARLGLDLPSVGRQIFRTLSGGQKQKILISIALGRGCGILVMDEPFANLDPAARTAFFELLVERRRDCSMLISSHRLYEVSTLVNRVVELERGRVTLDDRVADSMEAARSFRCAITIGGDEAALGRALAEWNFLGSEEGLLWNGVVPGADRLRFLATLSRYAGLLRSLTFHEESTP